MLGSSPLDVRTALCLLVPPLMWAGNAVVGRWAADAIPPVTFNWLRWTLAALCLLPLAGWVLRPRSPLWRHWRYHACLGFLGVAAYNMLQYLALHTSSPVNVTLVASSTPVWMLLLGHLWFGVPAQRRQWLGAALSMAGVLLVLAQGDWRQLAQLRFVAGDGWMLLASVLWAFYSWWLLRPGSPAEIRSDWAAFLLAQTVLGLGPATVMMAGEWVWLAAATAEGPHIQWSGTLLVVLLFVAMGPSLAAYRCWGVGVQRAGPTVAAFFANLTPLFAALLTAVLWGEAPRLYHALAFVLIVAGIALPVLVDRFRPA